MAKSAEDKLGYTNVDAVDEPVNVAGSGPYVDLNNDETALNERERLYRKKREKFDSKVWLDRGKQKNKPGLGADKEAGVDRFKGNLGDRAKQEAELQEEWDAIQKERNRLLTQMSIVLRNWPVIEDQVLSAIQFTFNDITDLQSRLDAPKPEYEGRYPNKREIWRRSGGVGLAQDNIQKAGSTLRGDIQELGRIAQAINGLEDGGLDGAPGLIQEAEGKINALRVAIAEYLALGNEEYYAADELNALCDLKNATLQNYHDTQLNYMGSVTAYLQRLANTQDYDDFDKGTYYWDKEIERLKERGKTGKETETVLSMKDAEIPWVVADDNAGSVLKNYYATFDTVPISSSVSDYVLPEGNEQAGYTISRVLYRMSDDRLTDKDGTEISRDS